MVLCEDSDCTVCFFPYSRMDRIPRVLHCRHTFCELCLEAMQQVRSSYLAVACPLCRRVTCLDRGLSLQDALWVDSKQWEQIAEDRGTEAGEEDDTLKLEGEELETKQECRDGASGHRAGLCRGSARKQECFWTGDPALLTRLESCCSQPPSSCHRPVSFVVGLIVSVRRFTGPGYSVTYKSRPDPLELA
uniref:Im:7152348 n=1 Tax=Oryzias latipes TaxID=8090 RepID=A0A3P9HEH8_ORYLA